MQYTDQSASGLRYYLAAEPVDVEELTVIQCMNFVWNHHQIEMGILGASHFFRIDCGDGQVLSEIFACAEISTPGPFVKTQLHGEMTAQVQVPFGDMTYQFVPRFLSWEDGEAELVELTDRIDIADADHRSWGLKFEFPRSPQDVSSRPPLTLMYARVRGSFILKTAHCYPNEEQIVFTTTTMSRRR